MNCMKLVFKGFSNKSSLVRITKTTLPALWLVLLFAFALPLPAIADSQEVLQARREITGTVTDVESQPLPGVTVQVVGRQGASDPGCCRGVLAGHRLVAVGDELIEPAA